MNRKFYIIAVSGGVDSIVLLHKLIQKKPEKITYIVAHFNHGIREDSINDAKFVENLAEKYDCKFELGRAMLGKDASEEQAREARYKFLFKIKDKYKAEAIIIAHHKDDLIETVILNIIRNAGPRSLIGFTQAGILRPLIYKSKKELIKYAENHSLRWSEDLTNQDLSYTRNYVRHKIVPKLEGNTEKFLKIREKLDQLYLEIDQLSKKLLVQIMKNQELVRSKFVTLPYIVQKEVIVTYFRLNNIEYDKQMVENAVITIKVVKPDREIELSKKTKILTKKSTVQIIHPVSV